MSALRQPRKNPNAMLSGSGLPRSSRTLPERNSTGQLIDYQERVDELPMVTAPPTSPDFVKQLKARFQQSIKTCGTSARSAAEQIKNILSALGIKQRGRPHKIGGAQTAVQRQQQHRQHKKDEAGKQALDAKILAIKEAHSPTTGRYRMESTRSNSELEKIIHAKFRDGMVNGDDWEDVHHGRRVGPEGHGKNEDQEGAVKGETTLAQDVHPQGRRQNWGPSQEQKVRAQLLEDFRDEHLHEALDERGSSCISCDLCTYEIPVGGTAEAEADDSNDADDQDHAWVTACDHLENVHHHEMNKFMNNNLPAWIEAHDGLPGSNHERNMKPKPPACERDHERIRQEAIERKEPYTIQCACRKIIYNPAKDLSWLNYRDIRRNRQTP